MEESKIQAVPVLPLRDIVVFPGMIVPLFVGREKSVKALEEAIRAEKKILLVAQKNASVEEPKSEDLYKVGTLASVLQLLKLPDGTVKVLVEGSSRWEITAFHEESGFIHAEAERLKEFENSEADAKALMRSLVGQFEQYVKLNKKIPPDIFASIQQINDATKLADTVISHISLKVPDKQEVLEMKSASERLERIFSLLEGEIGVLNAEKRIRSRVKKQMEKTQREYYLNEQLKAIQKELGEGEDGKDELSEIEEKISKTKFSDEAREKVMAELKKLRNMSSMSAEASVIRNYLDWMVSIPWKKYSKVKANIKKAQQVLDEDHYGLEKVKDRILEYLAVQERTKKLKGPILCLVGPPGVGKTSLARSIARSTGRNFVKISLGGVRDEAEIRGHRRTYIGSMPGKIVQSMKKAKSSNPMMLLDEIDKMGSDFRGDPSSALLEVLDPEQNKMFNDHYIEVDYDLSDVMFVATANSLSNMPRPLLDRMEVIRISGYTEDEKVEIAKRHLIPKQMEDHGLKADEWNLSEEALRVIIRHYTREAGVRNLEREIANLTRKGIKEILMGDKKKIKLTAKNVEQYAGVRKFTFGEIEDSDMIGMTTGLAYTEFGGDILMIESVTTPGKGKTTITGKLGDVMQESVQAAISYVRSRSTVFGIKPTDFSEKDIHIHVPEGATPKDGPSAGIAMCTSIVSVLTGIPVKRTVAMTGEITLRGRVLPIGGLKEKLLAALRGGIKTVLIPIDNVKDLAEIPENVKSGLEIIPVSNVDEVLKVALTEAPQTIEWNPPPKVEIASDADEAINVSSGVIKH